MIVFILNLFAFLVEYAIIATGDYDVHNVVFAGVDVLFMVCMLVLLHNKRKLQK